MKWAWLVASVIFLTGAVLTLVRKGWDGWWIATGFGLAALVMVWLAAMTT